MPQLIGHDFSAMSPGVLLSYYPADFPVGNNFRDSWPTGPYPWQTSTRTVGTSSSTVASTGFADPDLFLTLQDALGGTPLHRFRLTGSTRMWIDGDISADIGSYGGISIVRPEDGVYPATTLGICLVGVQAGTGKLHVRFSPAGPGEDQVFLGTTNKPGAGSPPTTEFQQPFDLNWDYNGFCRTIEVWTDWDRLEVQFSEVRFQFLDDNAASNPFQRLGPTLIGSFAYNLFWFENFTMSGAPGRGPCGVTWLRQYPRDDDLGMPYSGKGRMWAPGSKNMPTSRQRSQRQGRHGGTYL